jgi:hypothetical protein
MLAFGLLLGLLAGCSPSDSTYLPALLEDPMAHVEWEGLEPALRKESKEGEALFGYSNAFVQQAFDVLDRTREDELVLELKEHAEAVGWDFEEEPGPSGVWRGREEIEEGRISLAIYINSAASERNLVVLLDYEEIY